MSKPTLEDRVAELERKMTQYLSGPRTRPEGTTTSTMPTTPQQPAMSPREFLLDKNPKSDNDKVLAMGFYLEMLSGAEFLDFDNLYGALGEAKEPIPKNRRDPPYQNVKKGYFREVGDRAQDMNARNRWKLTNTGIARVEAGFK